ncbi:MAG: DUF3798 domain-containing protein [Firmicutes bacterium]|nr:DUF3798 domain-containing protein [Bacillota bacterium]
MKKRILYPTIILAVLLLMLTAYVILPQPPSGQDAENSVESIVEDTITPIEADPPTPIELEKPFPGKIAIITNDITGCSGEEYFSAREIVRKYGEDKIIHKCWPVKFPEEGEEMIRIVQQIARDPDIKALVIDQAVQNTMAAVDKLLEIRNDMFLVAIQPVENPPDIAKRFNLILNADEISMGETMPRQAQKMGAKTFVHLSFPRHLSYQLIFARHEMLRENCESLGIEFVSHIVPDMIDIGRDEAQQAMLEEIPKLVAQYGQDTAFFTTNCGLQESLIKAVTDTGAIYPQPCCPSPFHGFPYGLLGLVSLVDDVYYVFGIEDTIALVTDQIIDKLAEKNMLGRVSNWPVPSTYLTTYAGAEYAIKWINGEAPKEGVDVALLEQCMADYAGVPCFARTLGSHETDVDVAEGECPNWFFVSEDYITY